MNKTTAPGTLLNVDVVTRPALHCMTSIRGMIANFALSFPHFRTFLERIFEEITYKLNHGKYLWGSV